MKKSYGKILVLAIITAILLTATLSAGAVEKEKESIWLEQEPDWGQRGFELTQEMTERMMGYLKEVNPAGAKELEKLREKNPEKFKAGLRKAMREQHRKRFAERMEHREQRQQRTGRRSWKGPDMRMRPGKHGKPAGQPHREMMRERLYEKHAEYIEWLEEDYPEEAKKLAELREKKPDLYIKQLWISKKQYGRIAEAAKENPKLAEVLKKDLELKKERDKLCGKIRAVSDEKKKKELIEQLEETVGARFDFIVKRKQIRYEQLRKKLEQLREQVKQSQAEVEKWKQAKNEKVEERLEELISQTEKFNWD